jgi:hypothetical protein
MPHAERWTAYALYRIAHARGDGASQCAPPLSVRRMRRIRRDAGLAVLDADLDQPNQARMPVFEREA